MQATKPSSSWACTGCCAPDTQNGNNSAQPQQSLKMPLLRDLCSSESTCKANTRKASPVSLTSLSHQQLCFLSAPQFYTASSKKSKPKHQQTKIKGKPKRRHKELVVGYVPSGTLFTLPWQGRVSWHLTSGLAESTGSQRDGQGCPQRPPSPQKMGNGFLDKDHLQAEARGTWVGAEQGQWPVLGP